MSGDDNASPVINLQTNFGGGKTHSMLALWHLAGGTPLALPAGDAGPARTASGYDTSTSVRRVAIVGNHFAPSGETKPDGTAGQHAVGRAGLAARRRGGVRRSSPRPTAAGTNPGAGLHDLLAAYAPAVILIDEWVAYARQL